MSQGALAFSSPASAPAPSSAGFRLLAGLDPRDACFVRNAAARIAAMDTVAQVKAALAEVPVECARMVETLTVSGLATRIAKELDPGARAALIEQVPDFLVARVVPLSKSYTPVKPWERKG